MQKNNRLKYHIYRYSNLLVSILCLFQLFLNKSEEKSSLFLGYSWRKIILSLIILLIIFAIFTLREKILNKPKNKVLNRFWLFFARTSQVPVIRSLWTIGLFFIFGYSLIFLLYIFINPFSNYSQLASKILGFLLFINFFSLTTLLVEADISIFSSSSKKFNLKIRERIQEISLINLFFFELIYSQFIFIVFNNVGTKIQSIDRQNGNHFLFISLWILIGLSGCVIYTYLIKIKPDRVNITRAIFRNNRIYYLILVSLVILILLFGHISYGANDDYSMMTIASGQIDGNPDAHLVYTNIIIGELLEILYTPFPSVNWYSIYLISVLFISSFILLRVLLSFFTCYPIKNIVSLVYFVFIPRFFYSFSFTTIAILGCFAGILLLIRTTAYPGGKRQWMEIFLGIFLVFMSGLIRLYAMLYVGLLMTPALLYIIFKLNKKILLYLMLIPLFLAFVSYIIDNQAYITNPEWNQYRTYNLERGMIHGTPKIRDNSSQQQFFDSIGWHQLGLRLFTGWFFIDTQVFSLESLKAINSAYKYSINDVSTVINTYDNLIKNNGSETFVFIAIVSLVFSFSQGGGNKIKKALVFILIYLIGIISVLSFVLRMPDYILMPSLLIFTIYILAIGNDAIDPDIKTLKRIFPFTFYILFLVAVLIFQTFVLINLDQTNLHDQETRTYLIKGVNDKISSTINPLVVFQGGVVPDDWVSPLSGQDIPFDYVPTGWLINSPPYNHMLKKHGIENLINAVYDRPNVYLFGLAENDVIEYLSEVKHIKVKEVEHYEFYISNIHYYSHIDLVRLSAAK